MIDIDFLVGLINDEVIKVKEFNHFLSIERNFENKKSDGFKHLFLHKPGWIKRGESAYLNFPFKDEKFYVSIDDYNRIRRYSERQIDNSSKEMIENQEFAINYFRQKIQNYDNGVNKKL